MKKQHWQDSVNALLGVWVFLSPWLLQHAMAGAAMLSGVGGTAMWNFYIVGIAIAVFAVAAVLAFYLWQEWGNLTLGAWLCLSPWLLDFGTSAALTWNAVIVGMLVFVLSGWVLIVELGWKQVST